MKNNNKNRKLKFIRTKNNLRLGITSFFVSRKVTDEYLKDIPSNHYDNFLEYSKKQLFKIYRLSNLNKAQYNIGYCGDDFIKHLQTEQIKLSLN